MNNRMRRLQEWMTQRGCAAAFVTPGTNFFYLTGWQTNGRERLTGLLLPAEGTPALIVPGLEAESASVSGIAEMHLWPDGADPYQLLADVAKAKGVTGDCWAFEKAVLSLAQYERIAAVAGVGKSCDAGEPLAAMRLHKDAAEIELLRKAANFLNPALDALRQFVRPGVTERQALAVLNQALEEAGSEGASFPGYVLSGPNAALPHGHSGNRVIERGDIVLVDFGAMAGGYCSDITRTFVCGEWTDRTREIYDVVKAAQAAGIAAGRPGAPCADVDRAARRVIEEAGYGQYFIHRTGHGLGLDVHEAPYMHGTNEQLLEPGMVYTVEPGIYMPGWGGVRIEEMVVVTADGCETLTTYPNDADAMLIK